MKEVNSWLIYSVISALEAAEASQGELGIDPSDETCVREAFARYVVPEVQGWSILWRDKLQLSLAYYIRKPEVLNYQVLAQMQDFSMPEPPDISRFFYLLWEALFPGDDIRAVWFDDVIENNDIMEINQIWVCPGPRMLGEAKGRSRQ